MASSREPPSRDDDIDRLMRELVAAERGHAPSIRPRRRASYRPFPHSCAPRRKPTICGGAAA